MLKKGRPLSLVVIILVIQSFCLHAELNSLFAPAAEAHAIKTREAKLWPVAALQTQPMRMPAPGETVEKGLAGGQMHAYELSLREGQFMRVVVNQRGIDVVVTLLGQDGLKLVEVDRPNGSVGPEELMWLATRGGKYRLEVRALEQTAVPGKYQLRLTQSRQSVVQDQKRLAAQNAIAIGTRLAGQGKPEALREAVGNFEEALRLWLETDDSANAAYAAGSLGDANRNLGNTQKAIEHYVRALSLHRLAKDLTGEGNALKFLGDCEFSLGENQKALDYFQQSLRLHETVGDKKAQGIAAHDVGRAYSRLGEKLKALDSYQKALVLERTVGDKLSEAATLNNMGGVYSHLGNPEKALEHYNQSLLLYKELTNRSGEAGATNGLGLVYMNIGQYRKALQYFEEAIKTFGALGESGEEAAVLDNLGEAYLYLGEHEKGLEAYQKALPIHKSTGDRYREAIALHGIGSYYSETRQSEKALDYLAQARELRKNLGDRGGEATTLFSIGVIYWDLREYQKSINYTVDALERFKQVGDRLGEASALYHIGWVYFTTTDNQKATEYLPQALAIYRSLGHKPSEISTLDTLSRAWANSGNFRNALESTQQKLVLLKAAGDQAEVAASTSIIGILYAQLGEPQNALDYLQQALPLHRSRQNRREEASALNGIGWVYYTLGDRAKSEEYYQQALTIWKALYDSDRQANVLFNLAELKGTHGGWEEARSLLAESVALEESQLKRTLLSGAEWQKQFFLRAYIRSLQLAISLNVSHAPNNVDATRLALTTVLRRKGRVLDAMSDEYSALRRNANPETLVLLDQLNQNISRQSQLRLRGGRGLSSPADQSALNELQERIEEAQLKLNAASFQFRLQSQEVTIDAVQKEIPEDAALVEFTLWTPFQPERDWLNKFGKPHYAAYILPGRGNPRVVDLGEVGRINQLSGKLRSLLRNPSSDSLEVKRAARELDEVVMKPVRQRLERQTRLLISPDGQLNLIPFAALVNESGEFLVTKYKISYLTSGRDLLRLQVSRQSNDPPIVVANPDFEDTTGRVTRKLVRSERSRGTPFNQKTWSPLPGTESEAEAIRKLIPNAILRTGGEATETEIKQTNAPSLLHFATHGFFLADIPTDEQPLINSLAGPTTAALKENRMLRSGLVLAGANHKRSGDDDGLLTAMEMAGLNLWGTKLVVLSACETGVGDLEAGEGVYGLRRALVLAGAESQIMSLWKVDDRVTAKLMTEYYKNLLKQGTGRADALREVQILMLTNSNTKHPYFWAAFIESGAWKEIAGWTGR